MMYYLIQSSMIALNVLLAVYGTNRVAGYFNAGAAGFCLGLMVAKMVIQYRRRQDF